MAINPITGLDEDEMNNDVDQMRNLLAATQNTPNLNSPPKRSDEYSQISDLLNKIYSKPTVSPDAQKATELRRAFSGILSQPAARQYDFVHGGYIADKAQDMADENRMNSVNNWVQEPIQRDKDQREQLRNMLSDMEKLENLKSQGAQRDYLNAQRAATTKKTTEEEQDKIDSRNPDSQKSSLERPNTKAQILSLSSILSTASDRNTPEFQKAAETLGQYANNIDKMSWNDQQTALKNAKEQVDAVKGVVSAKNQGKMVAIAGGRLALDKDKEKDKNELHLTKPQEKLNTDINKLNIGIQQMEELLNLKSNLDTGPARNIWEKVKGWADMQDPRFTDLKSLTSRIFNRETKELAGSAVSESEWSRIEPMIPSASDQDSVFVSKLQRALIEAKRILAERTNEYQKKFGQPLDTSDVAKNALSNTSKGHQDQSQAPVRIKVRRKADGKTGSIDEKDFDSSKYERL